MVARLRNVLFALVWLVGLALVLGPASAGESHESIPPSEAALAYGGQANFQGTIKGSCTAHGVEFPRYQAGSLTVTANDADLLVRTVHVNATRVDKYWVKDDIEWSQTIQPATGGQYVLSWPSQGRAAVYPIGYYDWDTRGQTFQLEFNASKLEAHGIDTDGGSPGDVWIQPLNGVVARNSGSFDGPNRHVHTSRPLHAVGDVSIHLAQGSIQLPDGNHFEYPPWKQTFQTSDFVVGEQVHNVFTDVWLDVRDARFSVEPGHGAGVCGPITAQGYGTWTVGGATGTANLGDEGLNFDDKVVAFTGHVRWEETVARDSDESAGRRMQAEASGRIQSLAVDFETLSVKAGVVDADPVRAAGLAALAAALVAWLAYEAPPRLVGFFYARFGPEKALHHPRRKRLYELVKAHPGLSVSAAARQMGVHRNTLRWHLGVLQRTRKVHTSSQGRVTRILPGPPVAKTKRAAKQAILAEDDRVAYAVAEVRTGPLLFLDLKWRIVERFDVTDRSARRIIQRARDAGLVEFNGSNPTNREVVLRPVE